MRLLGFNPHTHEGCDFCPLMGMRTRCVSIHTPTKGVTGNEVVRMPIERVSIHTPTKGVTLRDGVGDDRKQFQSTHPRRV